MKKCNDTRAFGFPTGIAIGYVITIIFSVIWGEGYYAPCVPELVKMMGSEIYAVVLQAVLCGLLGMACGAGSVIWEMEEWSIARQTGTYFLLILAVMMPIGYILHWMEHSVAGVARYLGIFTIIFVVIWLSQYINMLWKIKAINSKLK